MIAIWRGIAQSAFPGTDFRPTVSLDPLIEKRWLSLMLKTSVYQSLALQTRLRPLLDEVREEVTGQGVTLDLSSVEADLSAHLADLQVGYRDHGQISAEIDSLLDQWAGTSTLATRARNDIYFKAVIGVGVSIASGGGGAQRVRPMDVAPTVSRRRTPLNDEWRMAA